MPEITLPDNSTRSFDSKLTVEDLAAHIGPRLAKSTVAGIINGKLVESNLSHSHRCRH